MFKLIAFLPLVFIVIGSIFGVLSIKRAFAFLATFVAICWVLLEFAVIHYDIPVPLGVITAGGILSLIPGLLLAMVFGVVRKRTPAPIDEAVAAYKNLSDEEKQKLHKLARKGVRVGTRHFANYLRKKGHVSSAKAIREMTQ